MIFTHLSKQNKNNRQKHLPSKVREYLKNMMNKIGLMS